MSDFGDFVEDDAFDLEPADPEQVARKLHEIRHGEDLEDDLWDDLSNVDRGRRIQTLIVLLAWGRRQGVFR